VVKIVKNIEKIEHSDRTYSKRVISELYEFLPSKYRNKVKKRNKRKKYNKNNKKQENKNAFLDIFD